MSKQTSNNQTSENDSFVTPEKSNQPSQSSSIAPSPASINGEWKLVVRTESELIWHRIVANKEEWLTATETSTREWEFNHTRDDDSTFAW